MISSEILIGLIGACGSSLIATAAMLWGMRRWNRLVSPSARGMHTVPKPAGGALALSRALPSVMSRWVFHSRSIGGVQWGSYYSP